MTYTRGIVVIAVDRKDGDGDVDIGVLVVNMIESTEIDASAS